MIGCWLTAGRKISSVRCTGAINIGCSMSISGPMESCQRAAAKFFAAALVVGCFGAMSVAPASG